MKTSLLAASLFLATPLLAQSSGSSTYPATNFAATHNSYSGDISGSRGTIPAQLSGGARFIEYDINLGDFSKNQDYQIGHGSPGYQVDHTAPNPASNNLADWLKMLASWSDQNSGHAPIALGLDAKNNFSGEDSPSAGNPSFLNNELQQYLGARLFTAIDLGTSAWPAWTDLKGKIIVVLSGNSTNRERYRSDQGESPAIGLNAVGTAIVVYKSTQSSNLWYWYGSAQADGSFSWPVHGKYDSGVTPAVAINDAGTIVEVHKSERTSDLWSRVGKFQNGQVRWGDSQKIGTSGSMPSVAWTGTNTVTEVNVDSNGKNQLLTGTVDSSNLSIQWSKASSTTQPRFSTTTASAGSRSVTVATTSTPAANTLVYSTPQVQQARVVYPQIMFTEFQKGDSSQLENDNLWFWASSSSQSNWNWDVQARQAGKIVRMWDFESDDTNVSTPPNFPATNTPNDSWYTQYCVINSCQK
jgi:hypothetical protein